MRRAEEQVANGNPQLVPGLLVTRNSAYCEFLCRYSQYGFIIYIYQLYIAETCFAARQPMRHQLAASLPGMRAMMDRFGEPAIRVV
jgi:hypothetical protein